MDLSKFAKSWTAIDFCPEVIGRCKEMVPKGVNFHVMDMCQMTFDSESFDTVFDLSSGDHVSLLSYIWMLGGVYHVLRPGGFFITAYFNRDYWDKDESFDEYGYARAISSKNLRRVLEIIGFTITLESSPGPRSGFTCQK